MVSYNIIITLHFYKGNGPILLNSWPHMIFGLDSFSSWAVILVLRPHNLAGFLYFGTPPFKRVSLKSPVRLDQISRNDFMFLGLEVICFDS